MCNICDTLKINPGTKIDIADYQEFHTSLVMTANTIEASDEGMAIANISYCPFCGAKL